MSQDPAAALRAFRLIAHHGSFTRAAAELDVTASALSQTLRQLEQHLGVRLLHRTTRHVGLTEAGREFLERIGPALTAIDDAIEAAHRYGARPSGTLRLATAHTALLGSLLSEFLLEYPDITLDVRVDSGLTDIVSEGFDAGIRLGERIARDMVAVPIGGPMRSLVAGSPAYFERHGRPGHPRELDRHHCVRFRFPTNRSLYRWEFAEDGRWFELDVHGQLIVNDNGLAVRAALDGFGLVHLPEPLIRDDLAAGRLQSVLDAWLPPYDGLYLYYPSRFQVPPKLRAFIDFLRHRLRPAPR